MTTVSGPEALQSLLSDGARWRSSEDVGFALDPLTSDPKAVAAEARRDERIFAAWDGARFYYPTFQFDAHGRPRALTPMLIRELPRDESNVVGNDACLWVFQPDWALDGYSPAELFPQDPERVIKLARRRRDGSDADD
jgi:hypothetical protein